MKRLLLVFAAMAVMAAVMVVMAMPALAVNPNSNDVAWGASAVQHNGPLVSKEAKKGPQVWRGEIQDILGPEKPPLCESCYTGQ